MNSASLCSLAGRYNNPIPPWFLAPIDFWKIPALMFIMYQINASLSIGMYLPHRRKRPKQRLEVYVVFRIRIGSRLKWVTGFGPGKAKIAGPKKSCFEDLSYHLLYIIPFLGVGCFWGFKFLVIKIQDLYSDSPKSPDSVNPDLKHWSHHRSAKLFGHSWWKIGDEISSELEFLKSLWGLGIEEEEGYRTGPPGYIGRRNLFLGIDSWAP
jgi:hypothetical protein